MLVVVAVPAVACAEHGKSPPPDAPPPVRADADEGRCTPVTLDAAIADMQVEGPWTLGTAILCLHLDASRVVRGTFSATTSDEPGQTSSFELMLIDAASRQATRGNDFSSGTTVHSEIRLQIMGGTVRDMVLHVRARTGVAPTAVSLALLDPLE